MRTGTKDKELLRRTFNRTGGMEQTKAAHDALDEMSAASMRRKEFNISMPTSTYPGQVTHLDTFSISIADFAVGVDGSRIGYRYGMMLIDCYSRRWQFYALRTLAEDEICLALQWYTQLLGTGAMHISHWVLGSSFSRRSFHTDGGTSLVAASVEKALAQLGFSSTLTSAPDSPSSNGIAERAIQSIKSRIRALMPRGGGTPVHDWHFAAQHAAASRNRLVSRHVSLAGAAGKVWRSPEELFFGTPATFKHHVAFGARCRVLLVGARAQARGTLGQRAILGHVYLWGGHGLQIKGTFRYVLGYVVRCDNGSLLYSRDVWVNEMALVEGGFSSLGAAQPRAGVSVGTGDTTQLPTGGAGPAGQLPDGAGPSSQSPDLPSPEAQLLAGMGSQDVVAEQQDSGSEDEGPAAFDLLVGTGPAGQLPEVGSTDQPPNLSHGDSPFGSPPFPRADAAPQCEPPEDSNDDNFVTTSLSPVHGPPLSPIAEQESGASFELLEDSQQTLDLSYDEERSDRSSRSRPQLFPTALIATCFAVWNGQNMVVPKNYKKAMQSPEAEQWRTAIDEHLEGHDSLNTFEEVVVPHSTRILPSQWVFAVKEDQDGNATRFKARTVLLGNLQRPGIDYQEVFSPTIRPEQVRLLVAIGAKEQANNHAFQNASIGSYSIITKGDVKDAYLNSSLNEDEQPLHSLPQGYIAKTKAPPGYKVVGRSLKAHPGLRQSGRAWHRLHKATLLELGFTESPSAPCIYVKDVAPGEYLIAGGFVDDLIFLNLTRSPTAIEKLASSLRKHYEIKLSDRLDKFLGAVFEPWSDGLYMHLEPYINGLLERFGMSSCSPAKTPEADARSLVPSDDDEELLSEEAKHTYQSITGGLMFAMVTCRPDLAHAVNMLARRMSAPRAIDMKAARRALKYLRGRERLGLLFKYGADSSAPTLTAYADSDWANDPVQRKSTTGYIVFYNGAAISWHSGLQSTISLSTCEAEYVALSECSREVDYLRSIVAFVQHPENSPTAIFEDNQGTIDLVGNPVHHRRTKHVEVKYHYIRDAQESGRVLVHKVHTSLNHADILTKATDVTTFTRHIGMIMVNRR